MSGPVTTTLEGDLAVIRVDNPPVNALGQAVRQGLVDAIGWAEGTGAATAILIEAAGRTFPAGADIAEFGKPPRDPWLPAVCNRIEAATKPVVVALHGTVLGGGCEVALAAHYRIAEPKARIGLPEVTLGLVPGAGGTQRAPRLAGAAEALELMLTGTPIGADLAVDLGLVDRIAEGPLAQAARDYARALVAEGAGPRPTREVTHRTGDGAAFLAAVDAHRARLRRPGASPLMAPLRIVDCVEACVTMPFDTALRVERAAFFDCLESDQSKALRHAFFAERRAAKFPELDGIEARKVNSVGIVGGGLMGSGIAMACLQAGLPVTLVERDAVRLDRAVARVTGLLDRAVAKGRMDDEGRARRMEALKGADDLAALTGVEVVIEAAVEDFAVKTGIFADLGRIARPGTVLATNTSYLDVAALAEASGRPADMLGLHFFSPAHVMTLVEVVVPDAVAPDAVAAAVALVRRLGKVPVRAGVSDGFIGNRILSAYRLAAEICLEDGATPAGVDRAMREYGFPLGPFQVSDMAGLDIAWARRRRMARMRDPGERYVAIADRLCERGYFGQKSGRGYYRYPDGQREGVEDPEVAQIIATERAASGRRARQVPGAEIRRRCLTAMTNAGARLLAEGVAQRPSDVDVVMIHGYGFPRWRGGPMMAADLRGLLAVKKDLDGYAPDAPHLWTPAPVFADLIKNGRSFADLND